MAPPHHNLIYAGVGSRDTPDPILAYMHGLAGRLANRGYVLRSGAADGADAAFEAGCVAAGGAAEIWLPWHGFNGHGGTGYHHTPAHVELAERSHPAWARLSRGARALHARNVGQIFGSKLDRPVSFVVAYTADGCECEAARTPATGGTATAIVLAARCGIPVFNLANPDAKDRLARHVLAECRRFHSDMGQPEGAEIWVFGSNLAGRHGKGAALIARERFGAVTGQGAGEQGQSYAIPTKDDRLVPLPIEAIHARIERFLRYAKAHPELEFYVTRIACGLAGFADADIAPFFAKAPSNCIMPEPWRVWLGRNAPIVQGEKPRSAETKVVHVRHAPYDVYIGRQNGELPESIWHNPYAMGPTCTREQAVSRFADHLAAHPELMAQLDDLRGLTLGCWCKTPQAPDTLCHGDVLATLADRRKWALPAPRQGSLF